MTDTLIEPERPKTPRYARPPLGVPALAVACPSCGHPTHYDACQAVMRWWQRVWHRRRFCCCINRTWVAP